jgi:hypothetical protein
VLHPLRLLRHRVLGAACLLLILPGCGTEESSLNEYVEQVQAVMNQGVLRYEALVGSPEGQVLIATGEQLADFTPQQLQLALNELADIQNNAMDSADTITPPEQIADLHVLFFRRLPIEKLAARAGTATDWYDLSESAEMIEYRNMLIGDKEVCAEFQATLDATEQRGAFVDTPWIPGEMKEIVDTALGCSNLPENPGDFYRPPPLPED